MGIRHAEKAGSWYAAGEKALAAEVDACVREAEQLYGVAKQIAGKSPIAIVVPHAGLPFSGPVAAVAYRLLRGAYKQVDRFLVFGACHRARLNMPAIWESGSWETPMGPIAVDEEFARAMVREGIAEVNENVHYGDNSIELQTPFIKRLFPEAKLVPLAFSPIPDAWIPGERAWQLASTMPGTTVAIASTDLTHYGAAFNLMPAGTGPAAVAWTRKNDQPFLEALLNLELPNIVIYANRDLSACGAGAAAAVAGWAKAGGTVRGRLLAHTNSYEIRPQGAADHLVGYASVVFESPHAS